MTDVPQPIYHARWDDLQTAVRTLGYDTGIVASGQLLLDGTPATDAELATINALVLAD